MKDRDIGDLLPGDRVPRELFLGPDAPDNFYERRRYLADEVIGVTEDLTLRKHRRRSPKLLLVLIGMLRKKGFGESYNISRGLGSLKRRVKRQDAKNLQQRNGEES